MKLQFCGAAKRVTGSCHFLDLGNHKVLVDCGMFQGYDDVEKNMDPFPFNPSEIEYIFLTHAHLDHCGRLPMLVKQGFHGKIISTAATKDLVRIILQDSAKVQYWNLKKCTRKDGIDCEERQLYTKEEAEDVMQYFETYPYGNSVKLSDYLEFRMRDAGHILGSAIFELWASDSDSKMRKFVFSGDLGQPGQRIIVDPDMLREADYVIVESTYGNRVHKDKSQTTLELLGVLKEAQKNNGNVLIPSFAVERSQEILYELNMFVENKLLESVPIFFDSPLAQKATEIFRRYPDLYDEDARRLLEAGDDPFVFPGLEYVKGTDESRRLAARKGVVIIAGSGMLNGGRIRYHLQNNISDSNSHLVFSGFQVRGTLGRSIIDGTGEVNILGKNYKVEINVHTLGGFSAHADLKDLEYWLSGFGKSPRKVFMVHGDEEVTKFWADYARKTLELETYVPDLYEEVELN